MHDFFIYEGKAVDVIESTGSQCADYVMKLCETLPSDKNFVVYFDNYFTSFKLQRLLLGRGIHSVGTMRVNRLDGLQLKDERQLKKEGRGAMESWHNSDNNLNVIRWMDNRTVTVSSTCFKAGPRASVARTSGTRAYGRSCGGRGSTAAARP